MSVWLCARRRPQKQCFDSVVMVWPRIATHAQGETKLGNARATSAHVRSATRSTQSSYVGLARVGCLAHAQGNVPSNLSSRVAMSRERERKRELGLRRSLRAHLDVDAAALAVNANVVPSEQIGLIKRIVCFRGLRITCVRGCVLCAHKSERGCEVLSLIELRPL